MSFRAIVFAEYDRRRRQNPRYSLRGYARTLGVHHATVSRLFRGSGPVPAQTIRAIGERLGVPPADLRDCVRREDIVAVTRAIRRPSFRPNSRWLASVSNLSIDRVNVALQAMLVSGRLRMLTPARWTLTDTKGVE